MHAKVIFILFRLHVYRQLEGLVRLNSKTTCAIELTFLMFMVVRGPPWTPQTKERTLHGLDV